MHNRLVATAVLVAIAISTCVLATPSTASTARPAVTGLSERNGPASGRTKVVVSGHGFSARSTVAFGSTHGRSVKVLSSTRIRVSAPSHAPGAIDVRVTTPAGTSARTRADRFTFVGQPAISKLSVRKSLPAGGVRVTLSGSNFVGVRSLTFGSTEGTHIHVSSSRSLQVTAPAHKLGTVSVRLLATGGYSKYVDADQFTYADPFTDVLAPTSYSSDDPTINGTDCPAANTCFAVGSIVSDDEDVPLVESTGHVAGAWHATTLQLPDGIADPGWLSAVSCPSTSQCYAVGAYVTDDGDFIPLLEHLINGGWQASAVELPDGTTEGYLSGIDCPSTTMCAITGTALAAGGESDTFFATSDNDQDFTSVLAPAPEGYSAKNVEVDSLDCASATSCVAVSDVVDQSDDPQATSELFNGSTWTSVNIPVPDAAATTSLLDSVSCTTGGTCIAVGRYDTPTSDPNTYTFTPMISRLAGTTWKSSPAPALSGTNTSDTEQLNDLDSVSCAGTYCEAVGAASRQGTATALIERSTDGKTWTASAQSAPFGTDPDLDDVACASASFCVATGTASVQGSSSAFAVLNSPGALTNEVVPLPATTSGSLSVSGLSCATGSQFCAATGVLNPGGKDTLLTVS